MVKSYWCFAQWRPPLCAMAPPLNRGGSGALDLRIRFLAFITLSRVGVTLVYTCITLSMSLPLTAELLCLETQPREGGHNRAAQQERAGIGCRPSLGTEA